MGTLRGSANPPATTATPAGAAFDKLKEEVESTRRAARSQGIIHLGMREASRREVGALLGTVPARAGGVHQIRAYDSEGKVEHAGKTFDLQTEAGQRGFRDALIAGRPPMPMDRADRLMDTLAALSAGTRDESAQLAVALHRIGTGDLRANRLVLSGHGNGSQVISDGGGAVSHDTIRGLARMFPEGAAKVEHLAVSACFSAKLLELDQFREAFSGLKSVWAYSGPAPLAETQAPQHLRTWARMTGSGDPAAVDPRGKNAATWNSVDGAQHYPDLTLEEAEARLAESVWVWQDYQAGRRTLPAAGDPSLNQYYQRLQDALSVRELPAARRMELEARRDAVLELRHPELWR
jgi:hypothetical protein